MNAAAIALALAAEVAGALPAGGAVRLVRLARDGTRRQERTALVVLATWCAPYRTLAARARAIVAEHDASDVAAAIDAMLHRGTGLDGAELAAFTGLTSRALGAALQVIAAAPRWPDAARAVAVDLVAACPDERAGAGHLAHDAAGDL